MCNINNQNKEECPEKDVPLYEQPESYEQVKWEEFKEEIGYD